MRTTQIAASDTDLTQLVHDNSTHYRLAFDSDDVNIP